MDIERLNRLNDHDWEIPKDEDMNVPGRIFASRHLVEGMDDKVKGQITNVASLPGIVNASLAMPDAHWGYGFPIGGVAAFDAEEDGVICMGGVGFDISCGVRSMRTDLTREDLDRDSLERLTQELFDNVPAGLGSTGDIKLNLEQIDEVLEGGAVWAVERGYGTKKDLEFVEEFGRVDGADPSKVSHKAKKRQFKQVGTLGSGNHYCEVQYVSEVHDEEAARTLGLEEGQILVSFHCGSRALGHQIGTDYLKTLGKAAKRYNIPIKDRELACAPIDSPEGQEYYSAMVSGINCALANRQAIAHLVREATHKVFPDTSVETVYDISHNTCKKEEHEVDGVRKELYVHRKGATRAFGPGHGALPERYMDIGQPVIIGGTMGTCSYILVGTEFGTASAWGSACHGAGRNMSRTKAKKKFFGKDVIKGLGDRGIIVKAHSNKGVAEEAPGAYKAVEDVVDSIHDSGLAKKVVMVRPIGSIKG